MFNANFNNISAISWQSVLLVATSYIMTTRLAFCNSGVMIRVPDWSVVGRGFESRSDHTIDYTCIKLVYVASPLSMSHQIARVTSGWLGITIMCPTGITYLPVD